MMLVAVKCLPAGAAAAAIRRARGLDYPPSVLHETLMPLRQAHYVRAHGTRLRKVLRPKRIARQRRHRCLQRHDRRIQ